MEKKHQERLLGRPEHSSSQNPTACFSHRHSRGNWEREYCGKSDIFSRHPQKMFTVVSFSRANVSGDCPGWVTVVRLQCLQSTETPKKDWYRSVALCIVSAFMAMTWAQLDVRWVYFGWLLNLSNFHTFFYSNNGFRCWTPTAFGLLQEFLTWRRCCNLAAVITAQRSKDSESQTVQRTPEWASSVSKTPAFQI